MNVPARLSTWSIAERGSRYRLLLYIWLLCLLAFGLGSTPANSQNITVLVGSGSTVPARLYSRMAQEYNKRNPNIQMQYVQSGTSEGIKHISHAIGDFGAGEAQLTELERKQGGLIELPVVVVGIVPIYNLPGIRELRLSGEVLAEIFLGEVKTWNAPQVVKLNPKIRLPNLPIQVVNRAAGKGSNYVFTEFLSQVSSKFRAQVGITASPKWPVGAPEERSSDMANRVKNSPGSIGYVEYRYAVESAIAQIAVLNPAGRFVEASTESITAACKAVEEPRWNRFSTSLTNAPGANSFPIVSFTWIYLRIKSTDSARAVALANFLDWIYTDGQQFAIHEGYSELPPPLLAAVRKKVKDLQ
jgi:phosphate transport system substrate-binding protein